MVCHITLWIADGGNITVIVKGGGKKGHFITFDSAEKLLTQLSQANMAFD